MKNTFNYLLFSKMLLKSFFFSIALFSAARIVFIIRFGSMYSFIEYSSDILPMAIAGLRFDLQSIGYILFFIYLINFSLLFSSTVKLNNFIKKLSIIFISITLTLSTVILIADQQFYSFFKLHFNSVAFDFFNEDPKLLMKSMWQEHPVIPILVITVLLFFIIKYVIANIFHQTKLTISSTNLFFRIGIIIIFFGLYFLVVRGSVGTFPLQKEDAVVSENKFLNISVLNGLYTLEKAYAEKKREFNISSPENILNKNGYKNINEAFADYKGLPIDSLNNMSFNELAFSNSNINQSGKKYHVVYLIMESMSNHFLYFHNEKTNLLGRFERHYNEDIVFRNFQSAGNGTISSLEAIILNTPYRSLFETKYRFLSFDFSIAKPFKEFGYKTNFITGIPLSWRQLNEALPKQYFDYVCGKASILRNSSKAKTNNAWGVYDHCMLDYIYDELIKSDSAMFVLSLSSTNHTPYELPEDYIPYKIDSSIFNNPEFIIPKERAIEVLTAYQYSNDALGGFLDKVKSSKLAENTIVIITGDHNNRSVLAYNSNESMKLKYSVPLYMYIPQSIKENLFIDTKRWTSHNDIMTSIYPYILNGVEYLNLGQNIFDETKDLNEFYSINDAQILFEDSANENEIKKKVKARNAILKYYYSKQIYNIK
ncbi:MAG: sulfatase-like hydrolase/transferase [Salinivirgaceae bacterium]|nr:sulfatase-like hydrolase/transferase [Salinivirgaceae bacterium]